jgi:hypothetical protein
VLPSRFIVGTFRISNDYCNDEIQTDTPKYVHAKLGHRFLHDIGQR